MKPEDTNIAVLGAGSWGTALALHLGQQGYPVNLWVFEPDLAEEMADTRENARFLPGHRLPHNVVPSNHIDEVLQNRDVVVIVTPSHVIGPLARRLKPLLSGDPLIVNASKGLEEETLLTVSQVLRRELGDGAKLATLSGPTFAREVARQVPSTIVAASQNAVNTEAVQDIFTTEKFRVFTSSDPVGVEIGGSIKNVIAIAAGICDGLGLGHNTRAGLITRGLVEISRIGTAMGARPETFYGLSGLGDLILTCTGDLSRNRTVGLKLGQGQSLSQITAGMQTVAEGIKTVKSAFALKEKYGIQASIIEETYRVLYEEKSPANALEDLMRVQISNEFSGVRGIDAT